MVGELFFGEFLKLIKINAQQDSYRTVRDEPIEAVVPTVSGRSDETIQVGKQSSTVYGENR